MSTAGSARGAVSGGGAGGFAALLDCRAAIHPDLGAHGTLFERKIHRVGDRVYCAVGYNLANIIAVVGPEGMVVRACNLFCVRGFMCLLFSWASGVMLA